MKYSFFTGAVLNFLNRNKLFFLFLVVFLAFITYFFRGVYILDPDFGWRIRFGQIIYKNGIPRSDPFSYTMPSFYFVDHSWLFSLLIGLTYPIFKNNLLSLFLSFLVFLSVYFSGRRLGDGDFEHTDLAVKYERWLHPMVITSMAFLIIYFSVRAQVISWFLFSVLNLLLFSRDYYSRYKYFVPILFFIWANLHGGYSLGLIVLIYFTCFRWFVSRKGSYKDIFILLTSIFITLATPYGFEGWREVASSIFDSRLRLTISEWMPTITTFDISMAFYIAMSTFFIIHKRKDIPKIQYFLFLGMLVFGLTSRRNMPFYVLYTLPLTIFSLNKLYLSIKGSSVSRERYEIAFQFVRIFSVVLILFQLYFAYWKSYFVKDWMTEKAGFYPAGAVSYLKERSVEGEVFSSYGWGGYLIWTYSEKKVFIDGRMPSWRFVPEDGSAELPSAMDEYLKIENGDVIFNDIAGRFDIRYVLWPKEKEGFFAELEKRVRNTGIFKDKNDFSFTEYLKENNWKIVYSDETSDIYRFFGGQRL